ncbi:MAG: BrnA antitoxin family protein [Alphaproteobacteria bacterium]|nr:BrnA antitoxin family protein [Alphaproteobacteria bacterium]
MPKLKRGTIHPSAKEEAAIASGIAADPDSYEPSDAEWKRMKPYARLGRPPAAVTKERITIRLSREVLNHFRAGGPGWQTRIDELLKKAAGL